jgi:hypothetical protein
VDPGDRPVGAPLFYGLLSIIRIVVKIGAGLSKRPSIDHIGKPRRYANLRRVLELADAHVHPLQDLIDLNDQAEVQMTQTQMVGYLVEKIGIDKKQVKLTLDELNTLVVRELKKEGSIRFAGLVVKKKVTPQFWWCRRHIVQPIIIRDCFQKSVRGRDAVLSRARSLSGGNHKN